jgi:hypothetical protein
MEAKEICKPFFSQKVLKRATTLTWFEKFCLFFIKSTVTIDKVEMIKTVWKSFRGKVYIIDQSIMPPEGFNCRHTWNPKH